jgi:hypothetical protein
VNQLGGLLLNCGDNVGMAMSCGYDGDARGEIQEYVDGDICDYCTAS